MTGAADKAAISADDIVQVRTLYAAYNRAIDAGDAEAWAGTFIDDGVFHHPAAIWRGQHALFRFVTERNAKIAESEIGDQRHWNDAITLDATDDTIGLSASCALLVSGKSRADRQPVVVATGRYVDRLVRTAGGWRFAERRLIVA